MCQRTGLFPHVEALLPFLLFVFSLASPGKRAQSFQRYYLTSPGGESERESECDGERQTDICRVGNGRHQHILNIFSRTAAGVQQHLKFADSAGGGVGGCVGVAACMSNELLNHWNSDGSS